MRTLITIPSTENFGLQRHTIPNEIEIDINVRYSSADSVWISWTKRNYLDILIATHEGNNFAVKKLRYLLCYSYPTLPNHNMTRYDCAQLLCIQNNKIFKTQNESENEKLQNNSHFFFKLCFIAVREGVISAFNVHIILLIIWQYYNV